MVPFENERTAELSPDQVVDLMFAALFDRAQILALGVDLRNALALHGGARIRTKKYTAAIFLVQNGFIFATLRDGDDVTFDLEEPFDETAESNAVEAREEDEGP